MLNQRISRFDLLELPFLLFVGTGRGVENVGGTSYTFANVPIPNPRFNRNIAIACATISRDINVPGDITTINVDGSPASILVKGRYSAALGYGKTAAVAIIRKDQGATCNIQVISNSVIYLLTLNTYELVNLPSATPLATSGNGLLNVTTLPLSVQTVNPSIVIGAHTKIVDTVPAWSGATRDFFFRPQSGFYMGSTANRKDIGTNASYSVSITSSTVGPCVGAVASWQQR